LKIKRFGQIKHVELSEIPGGVIVLEISSRFLDKRTVIATRRRSKPHDASGRGWCR
jgi:hypothetical protein